MLYPLAIGGVCILTSIIGTFFVKLGRLAEHHGRALQGLLCLRRAVGHRAVAGDRLDHRHEGTSYTAAGTTFTGPDLYYSGARSAWS